METGEAESQAVHPLKVFDLARRRGRLVYALAPMVRYGKLAFRQTASRYGVDLAWTPMIVAKEFNRNQAARDSDLTLSTRPGGGPQPPTVVQFGAGSALEFARAASLAAPAVGGVDLNCGCPQSWACAESLGAALMERRELVRDMALAARARLRAEGWLVGLERDMESPLGRSISVKIRIHNDLRKTIDFIDTVVGDGADRNIDFLTIHPRTRHTSSRVPINVEALQVLTDRYGGRLPVLVSGDVFSLSSLPFSSPLLVPPSGGARRPEAALLPSVVNGQRESNETRGGGGGGGGREPRPPLPDLPRLAGLMSARGILANPALYAGHERCPWEAVELFINNVVRAPLPLKLVLHHLSEMCGPGMGPDKASLLTKRERAEIMACADMCDVIDFLDEKIKGVDGRDGLRRLCSDGSLDSSSNTPRSEANGT